jgi:hypothetical protein
MGISGARAGGGAQAQGGALGAPSQAQQAWGSPGSLVPNFPGAGKPPFNAPPGGSIHGYLGQPPRQPGPMQPRSPQPPFAGTPPSGPGSFATMMGAKAAGQPIPPQYAAFGLGGGSPGPMMLPGQQALPSGMPVQMDPQMAAMLAQLQRRGG